MAATAEALMNSLAGGESGSGEQVSGDSSGTAQTGGDTLGSDRGDHEISGGGAEQNNQGGSPAGGGSGGTRANTGVDQSGQQPDQGRDQVANLNAAIRETRTENKALKAQLQELTAKIEALSKPPAAAVELPPEPDFLADPKAYVDDAKSKLAKLTEQIESEKKQQTEAQQKQQQAQETWNKVVTAEQEFAAATPDYYDAINHVRAIRAEQIKIEVRETLDRDATEQEVAQILSAQEAQGAAQLIAKGKNPSKFYYEYAKTFGYKPKAASDPATSTTTTTPKPDKDAVRTMGSGGAADSGGGDEPAGDSPLGGLLAAAQNEHRAQFKRGKR